MQNKRTEPKGNPKLYIDTARGEVRLELTEKIIAICNFCGFLHMLNIFMT